MKRLGGRRKLGALLAVLGGLWLGASPAQAQGPYGRNSYEDFPFNQGSLFYRPLKPRPRPRVLQRPAYRPAPAPAPGGYTYPSPQPYTYVRPRGYSNAPQRYYAPQYLYAPRTYYPAPRAAVPASPLAPGTPPPTPPR